MPRGPAQNAEWERWNLPGVLVEERMMRAGERVELRVIEFSRPEHRLRPPVVFVPGWITRIETWREVLEEMTRDFRVLYIETREKISSRVRGRVVYSVEAMAKDIAGLISVFGLDEGYVLFGSSLGATVIADAVRFLEKKPGLLFLIGPNAVFRIPLFWRGVILLFYPPLYFLLRPVIKWYLRTFRMDVDSDRAQYDKYCRALDAADPWKLKRAAMALWNYRIWERLPGIGVPALIIGAGKDTLHEPDNLRRMAGEMQRARYRDLETNRNTHTAKVVDILRETLAGLPALPGDRLSP